MIELTRFMASKEVIDRSVSTPLADERVDRPTVEIYKYKYLRMKSVSDGEGMRSARTVKTSWSNVAAAKGATPYGQNEVSD